MFFGSTGIYSYNDRLQTGSGRTVRVGSEVRGPEWGKGRAAQIFAEFHAELSKIPLGRRTEYDLLGSPAERKKKNGNR